MSVPPSSINVHTFDGQLNNLFISENKLNDRQKCELFNIFASKLSDPIAQQSVFIIVQSLGTGANFQVENNIDCSDIFVEIINHKNCAELLPTIQEQLSDIVTSGLCPSGRVTRLFQIWASMEKN